MSTSVAAMQPAPGETILQVCTGYILTAALYSATKFGVADELKAGPKPVSELAKACGVNEDALYRVLRALSSAGIFQETAARTFGSTPAAETLCTNVPGSLRDVVLWVADPFHFRIYAEMQHAVTNGKTVAERVTKEPLFDYFAKDKEESEVFNRAMTGFSAMLIPAALEAYDFSYLNDKTLVDVAGGHGHVLTSILKKYPKIKGVLFDLEHVVAGGVEGIQKMGVADRCKTASGDFFKAVPAGDAYMMKHILHDWDDERAIAILKCCDRAGAADAKLILLEAVLSPGNDPHMGKWLDLEMLVMVGGRERTEEDFRALFEKSGWRLNRVVKTKSPICVIEAEKA